MNIINTCLKIASYIGNGIQQIFNRTCSCCCKAESESRAKDALSSDKAEVVGSSTGSGETSVRLRNMMSIIKEPSEVDAKVLESAGQLLDEDSTTRLKGMGTLEKLILEKKSEAMNSATANALTKSLIKFLNASDPIDGSVLVKDNKTEIQMHVLELIPNLLESYEIENKVINDLVTCLIEKAKKNTNINATKTIGLVMLAAAQKTTTCNDIMIDYFISILNGEKNIAEFGLEALLKHASAEQKLRISEILEASKSKVFKPVEIEEVDISSFLRNFQDKDL